MKCSDNINDSIYCDLVFNSAEYLISKSSYVHCGQRVMADYEKSGGSTIDVLRRDLSDRVIIGVKPGLRRRQGPECRLSDS